MDPIHAVILGIVEGLTEYLPVSSTGHLILASHVLGQHDEAAKSFDIVIQLGAIMAVLVHYRALLSQRLVGVVRGQAESIRLVVALALGFAPVAVAGLVLRKVIKEHLFGPIPVAVALALGGVVMIVVERLRRSAGREASASPGFAHGLQHVTWRRAIAIGLGQCLSLWPGTSRSMCTIVTGQLVGLSTATAAEFSFLLALPTLGAATLYELHKGGPAILAALGGVNLLLGLVVSFLVAWAVIAGFVRYLERRGLEPFGYYRILLAVAVLWLEL